jgi:hypothetical protein
MKKRIVKTEDGRIYHCTDCPYRERYTGFCGCCMRKILDEMKSKKKGEVGNGKS